MEPSLEFIEEILAAAGKELASRFGSPMSVREKPDQSLVTDADVAVEKMLVAAIQKRRPQDVIYAEESGKSTTDRNAGRGVWVIDPLDGTTNFANRYPFFCTSIGWGVFNAAGTIDVRMGGIIDPIQRKTYLAATGKGATCNGTPIRVTKVGAIGKGFLVTGFYYTKGDALSREISRFHRIAEACSSIRRDGAAALDMAMVAEGIYDGFWEMGLAPWDVAAGSVLVREAGGTVRNLGAPKGAGFDPENQSVVAANPMMAESLERELTVEKS